MCGPVVPAFIPIFTSISIIREAIMCYITDKADIENLCVAGGLQVRKLIFRKKRNLRNRITANSLKKNIKWKLLENSSVLGKFSRNPTVNLHKWF